MYKVFLVDDEPFITEGLKKIIDWNSYNLEVIGTASSGAELLSLFDTLPADIIITDICMDNISGLKIIETIKKINSDVKFIILSGYDDFAYVKEGMILGIENYLLKPINEQELILTLQSTVKKIERTVDIENFIKNDFNILKDNILYRWVTNNIEYQELLERSEILKIVLDYEYYMVTCIKILFPATEDSLYFNKDTSKIVSSLYSLCNKLIKFDACYMCFCDFEGNIVIITGSDDKSVIKKHLSQTLNNIVNEIKSKLSLNTFITVGDIQSSYSNVHESYSRSIKTQDYMLVLAKNNITYYNEIIDIDKINLIKEKLKDRLSLLNSISEIKDNKLSPIIKQILTYVNLNFNKDVCLKSLGTTFNINSAYLGQLFQKEINESLSEHVNNLRMEKSKELLMTTNLKNSDIATAVGFYDSNYFYRKFKEHFNISPSEFRCQGDGVVDNPPINKGL